MWFSVRLIESGFFFVNNRYWLRYFFFFLFLNIIFDHQFNCDFSLVIKRFIAKKICHQLQKGLIYLAVTSTTYIFISFFLANLAFSWLKCLCTLSVSQNMDEGFRCSRFRQCYFISHIYGFLEQVVCAFSSGYSFIFLIDWVLVFLVANEDMATVSHMARNYHERNWLVFAFDFVSLLPERVFLWLFSMEI
jgi:hypothetical protein